MMKRFTTFLMLAVAAASLASVAPGSVGTATAQNRHVFLEEFTGYWCGFCVRGAWALQKLDEKYPGQVVSVSIHANNGDPMENPQGDSLLRGTRGAQSDTKGFPDGWTARTSEGAAGWDVDPTQWIDVLPGFQSNTPGSGLVDQMVQTAAEASVTLDNLTFDPATRMVSVRLTATALSALTGDLRTNVIVTEDSVGGPAGSLYDQANYYYKGGVSGEQTDNPFWNQGTVRNGEAWIAGWKHMHVFREAVGGVWGASGLIPSSPTVGKAYTQTYSFVLPATIVDPNHVHLIGIVHQFDASDPTLNSVLDAASMKLTTAPVKVGTATLDLTLGSGATYRYAKAKGDTPIELSVTNNGSVDATADLLIDGTTPLPAGWSAKFSPATPSIPAGTSKTVTMTLTAPEQSAYLVPSILVAPKAADTYFQPKSYTPVGLLSDNTRYGMYYPTNRNPEIAAFAALPDSMRLHAAPLPMFAGVTTAFAPSTMDVAIIMNDPILDCTTSSLSAANPYGVPSVMASIDAMLAAGKKVFISSPDALGFAYGNGYYLGNGIVHYTNAAAKTKAVQAFFHDTLGISLTHNTVNVSGNAYSTFEVTGETGDAIGDQLDVTANQAPLFAYELQTPIFSLAPTSKSVPSFYANASPDSIIGVRYQSPSGARLVYLSFSLNSFSDQVMADTVFGRSIKWLMSAPTAPVNLSASPSTVNFGNVAVGYNSTVTVTLTNKGAKDITITGLNIIQSATDFSDGTPTLPKTVSAGGTTTVDLVFAPTTIGPQSATLTVNLGDASAVGIQLHGTGTTSGGVAGADTKSAVVFDAAPNPFHGTTEITYTAAAGERDVTFSAFDVLGREVAKLQPRAFGENGYVVTFDASTLADGTYTIIAHSTKGTHEVRVVNQR